MTYENLKSLFSGPLGQIAWPTLILLLFVEAAAIWAVYAATKEFWLQLIVFVVFVELYLVLSRKASEKRPFNETKATIRAKMNLIWWFAIPSIILGVISARYIYPDAGVFFWFIVWIMAPYTLAMNVRRTQRTH